MFYNEVLEEPLKKCLHESPKEIAGKVLAAIPEGILRKLHEKNPYKFLDKFLEKIHEPT